MNNKKPRNPLYPDGFRETSKLRTEITKENKKSDDEKDDLRLLNY